MQHVFVLDAQKQPLDPCTPARARQLLKSGKAAVFRRYPFTIILKTTRLMPVTQPHTLKIDPGSKTTGIAIIRGQKVVWAAELSHRGRLIKDALESRRSLRRTRRNRKTRYRQPRFLNRTKPKGWLPPSLQSRVENVTTWVNRLSRFVPIANLSMELVKFDTQQMQNPEVDGVAYQQGTLYGYEVREYLLEKWGRKCAYCGVEHVPFEIEHITPKSRGGSDRVSNLTIACHDCNQKKGNRTAAEFGFPQLQAKARMPLKDTAAVNATRWALYHRLAAMGVFVEVGTGARTKFNRVQQNYPKAHWIDAACVGESGACVTLNAELVPLLIKATGHGTRQMCQTDKYGFPIRHRARKKKAFGFQTGDMVRGVLRTGKYQGVYVGRVTIRQKPDFTVLGRHIHAKNCTVLHRADGYGYSFNRVT